MASCVYVNDDDQHLLFLRAGDSDHAHCPVHVVMVNRRVGPLNPDPLVVRGKWGVLMSDVGFNALLGKEKKGVLISGVSLERGSHFRDILREASSFQGCLY